MNVRMTGMSCSLLVSLLIITISMLLPSKLHLCLILVVILGWALSQDTLLVNVFAKRMKDALEEAKSALVKAKDDMSLYYNRRRTPAPTYKPGDKVWLDASDIKTTRPSQKLSEKR